MMHPMQSSLHASTKMEKKNTGQQGVVSLGHIGEPWVGEILQVQKT
jgi:hypothetical protein